MKMTMFMIKQPPNKFISIFKVGLRMIYNNYQSSNVQCLDSSVGRASDWRSEGPVFDPQSRHSFFSKFFIQKSGKMRGEKSRTKEEEDLLNCYIRIREKKEKLKQLRWFSTIYGFYKYNLGKRRLIRKITKLHWWRRISTWIANLIQQSLKIKSKTHPALQNERKCFSRLENWRLTKKRGFYNII